MDTSTLLAVFLLVTVATLASYALSHWSSIRSAFSVGWAATSIGTTFLLVAAAIVVLTFVFRGPLWRPDLGDEQRLRDAAASQELSRRIAASPFGSTTETASITDTTNNRMTLEGENRHRPDASPVPAGNKQSAQQTASTHSWTGRESPPLPSFKAADPWAATRCVYALILPLSEPPKWKLDNGCDTPVGVLVAGRGSIILPLPAHRPVSLDQQSVDFANYTACFIATEPAMTLIGAPIEERSSGPWRAKFESARANDPCLLHLARYGGVVVP